ncbi:MAG: IclR family transcriptional regulator [Clostridia bacterium]|nr:IclR family transcriptional regulator [Clostridia bacterium]
MEKNNRTVKRTLEIMELIREANRPLTCREIAQRLNIPQTSAFDITRTLLMEEYLEYAAPGSKAYTLGVKCFELGSGYTQRQNLVQLVQPYAERLMNLSNSTCFLASIYKHQIIYLNKIEAPTSVHTSAVLGSRGYMHNTGLGKAILARYPMDKVEEIFSKSNIEKLTDFTITTLDELKLDLERTRQRGYAIDDREGNIDVYCIAAPIIDHTSQPIAAISVAMMYSARTDILVEQLSGVLVESAQAISRKLGYSGSLY